MHGMEKEQTRAMHAAFLFYNDEDAASAPTDGLEEGAKDLPVLSQAGDIQPFTLRLSNAT